MNEARHEVDPPRPLLAVAACDFGWGSFGKLRLILEHLQDIEPVVVGSVEVAAVINRLLEPRRRLLNGPGTAADGALVINDPRATDVLSSAGVPVVYVDSLPYLWTTKSEVPLSVAEYCAQRIVGGAPVEDGPLAGRAELTWVDPIVPPPRERGEPCGIVVNVGGLHSHLSARAEFAYVELVVLPLVELLKDRDVRVAAVCGNIPAAAAVDVQRYLPEIAVGLQPAARFEDLVRRADALFSSPGSTTLLQAAVAGTPTVLLPPQNLSQILNAELMGGTARWVVSWPEGVLNRQSVENLRPHGEDPTLAYIYRCIMTASAHPPTRASVRRSLGEALDALSIPSAPQTALTGQRGAEQVAAAVRRVLGIG